MFELGESHEGNGNLLVVVDDNVRPFVHYVESSKSYHQELMELDTSLLCVLVSHLSYLS